MKLTAILISLFMLQGCSTNVVKSYNLNICGRGTNGSACIRVNKYNWR